MLDRESGSPRVRARALERAGDFADDLGASDDAVNKLKEANALAASVGDLETQVRSLSELAWIACKRQHDRGALRLIEQALALATDALDARTLGALENDRANYLRLLGVLDEAEQGFEVAIRRLAEAGDEVDLALALNNLANLEIELGRHSQAQTHNMQALEICERLGDESFAATALVTVGLGFASLAAGSTEDAVRWFKGTLEYGPTVGLRPLLYGIEGIAVALRREDPQIAMRLWATAARTRVERSIPRDSFDERHFGPDVADLRNLLGADQLSRELEIAATLTLDQAIQLALTLATRGDTKDDLEVTSH